MKDRIPAYPGRVKLTPVSGQTNTYDMVRADEPMQEGTPLNKNTLLRDATAEALGLTADATVDEALGKLSEAAFHSIETEIINPMGEIWTLGGNLPEQDYTSPVIFRGAYSEDIGRVVYIVNDALVYSDDKGETWAKTAAPSTQCKGITWAKGKFVLACTDTGVFYSTDAITWTAATGDFLTASNPTPPVYGNDMFMIAYNDGDIFTSADGITWTNRGEFASDRWGNFLAFAGGYFFCGDQSNKLYRSSNGISWETFSHPSYKSTIRWLEGVGNYICFARNPISSFASSFVYADATASSPSWQECSASAIAYHIPTLVDDTVIFLPWESGGDNGYIAPATNLGALTEVPLPTTNAMRPAVVAGDALVSIGGSSTQNTFRSLTVKKDSVTLQTALGESLMEGIMNTLGAVKIETGSYTGTGKYGAGNPSSLTFSFVPKIVFIFPYIDHSDKFGQGSWSGGSYPCGIIVENTMFNTAPEAISSFGFAHIKWTGTTVQWEGKTAALRLNTSQPYKYIAIG